MRNWTPTSKQQSSRAYAVYQRQLLQRLYRHCVLKADLLTIIAKKIEESMKKNENEQ